MPDLTGLFGALPYPGKVAAASLRGSVLRYRRYSRHTLRLIEETLERDGWDGNTWQEWTSRRLEGLLDTAATKVPYYRDYWRRHGGRRRDWIRLENWPITPKADVRADPKKFVSLARSPGRLIRTTTSGTTGTPVAVVASRQTIVEHYALVEARLNRWNGVSTRDRWAILGGQVVAAVNRGKPPYWVRNFALNQLYLSSHHISPSTAGDFSRILMSFQPSFMVVYPSSATFLAREFLFQELDAPKLKVVITNAESISRESRETLSSVFSCPVRETYGQVEMVAMASECHRGSLHLWPESGLVEVFQDEKDVPVKDGTVGRIVATGLLNDAMILVRYEVGDRGSLAPGSRSCACGRGLPVLEQVIGRLTDFVVTADGRRVFWLNPVFYGLPVKEAQIIQESEDSLLVLVVVAPGFGSNTRTMIVERLQGRVGGMHIGIEQVDRIPRGPNGKFRAVVSKIGYSV